MPKILALRCNDEPGLQCTIPGAAQVIYSPGTSDVSLSSIPDTHKKEIDYITVYGSHGNFQGGKPTQLNGLQAEAARVMVAKLKSLNVSAYTIILDCCFSAGFITDFSNLLVKGRAKPGTILCHYGSASGTMSSSLGSSKYTVKQAAVSKIDDLSSMGMDFVSLGVYVDGRNDKNFYIKSVADLNTASANYISIISGGNSEAADIISLKTYLKGLNINIKETSLQMVKTVMQNSIIV